MAAKIAAEIKDKQKERVEVSVIESAKEEVKAERKLQESFMKDYCRRVLFRPGLKSQDEGYQLLYCNNIDHPAKISFLISSASNNWTYINYFTRIRCSATAS